MLNLDSHTVDGSADLASKLDLRRWSSSRAARAACPSLLSVSRAWLHRVSRRRSS